MRHHFAAGCKSLPWCVLCAMLAVACAGVCPAAAQPLAASPATGPQTPSGPLVCDAPVYDFGERDNFTRVNHVFQLKNAGTSPLVIDRVLTTCGCTVANLTQKILAPGETVPLEVAVSFEGRKGAFEKHVYVLSGGDTKQKTRLTMKGKAIERIRISPPTVNLGYSAMDRPVESAATIEFLQEAAKFNVREARTDSPYLELTVETAQDGLKHTIHVRTRPPLPLGTHPAQIHVFTDNDNYPVLDIPVALRVVDMIEIVPKEVVVYDKGTGEADTAIRFLNIMPGSVTEFTVTGVETPVEGIVSEIIPRPENRYLVKLQNLPVDPALEGKDIVILTDVPGRERLPVPIRIKKYPAPRTGLSTRPAVQNP